MDTSTDIMEAVDDLPQLGHGCKLVEINGDIYAFSG